MKKRVKSILAGGGIAALAAAAALGHHFGDSNALKHWDEG